MPSSTTYYADAPSLASATVLYTDAALTIVAPNGYYSDGVIKRQQLNGVLLPQTQCPSCAPPCGEPIVAGSAQGIYNIDIAIGSGTGAFVIAFYPYNAPDGILATYNGTTYNKLLTQQAGGGVLQAPPSLPTYVGQSAQDCGLVANSPHILQNYDWNGTNFSAVGGTSSVTILSTQVKTQALGNQVYYMVIPKTSATPSTATIKIFSPCPSVLFDIVTPCPANLPSIPASSVHQTSGLACADDIDQQLYWLNVTTAPGFGLYDFVFTDPNGEFPASAGFYKTNAIAGSQWISVNSNGQVINSGTCISVAVTNVSATAETCGGGGLNEFLGANVTLSANVSVNTEFVVRVKYAYTGTSCSPSSPTTDIYVQVPANSSSSNFNTCGDGIYVPGGASICDACIVSCDNPAVTLTGFTC